MENTDPHITKIKDHRPSVIKDQRTHLIQHPSHHKDHVSDFPVVGRHVVTESSLHLQVAHSVLELSSPYVRLQSGSPSSLSISPDFPMEQKTKWPFQTTTTCSLNCLASDSLSHHIPVLTIPLAAYLSLLVLPFKPS